MKAYMIILTFIMGIFCGFVIGPYVMGAAFSDPLIFPKQEKFAAVNYDSLCVVGNIYTIYGVAGEKHEVVIISKNNGHVVYTYPRYVGDGFGFMPRTCREFIQKTQRIIPQIANQ